MRVVVDASVTIKWIVPDRQGEQDLRQARALLDVIEHHGAAVLAPPHWSIEVMSVIARLSPAKIDRALTLLGEINPIIVRDYRSLRRAAQMSADLRHYLFDTLYHAVAMEMEATLVTADDAYFDKAKPLGSIMRLADFPT